MPAENSTPILVSYPFLFAIIFIAITHNRLRNLSKKLDSTSDLNNQLNERYAKLVESDEEIRSHASQLLHDRIQAKLMLAGAKLTGITGVLSEEAKLGVLPVIKELESIRAIDVREVSQLLSPNLVGEGLTGSCENLCKEFEGSVEFTIEIFMKNLSLAFIELLSKALSTRSSMDLQLRSQLKYLSLVQISWLLRLEIMGLLEI